MNGTTSDRRPESVVVDFSPASGSGDSAGNLRLYASSNELEATGRPLQRVLQRDMSLALVVPLALALASPSASSSRALSSRVLPTLCVLDLDMCVWQPEMYTLWDDCDRPIRGDLAGRGEGVIGVHSGGDVIRMFPGALRALQQCHDELIPQGMRLAVASSADTPRAVEIGRQAMEVLEVLPGVTMLDVLRMGWEDGDDEPNLQIGRTKPLSSDKSRTHFPILKELTGVPYSNMLFFDDSAWSDHCGMVERNCPGVVTMRTPTGMTTEQWEAGLDKYHQLASADSAEALAGRTAGAGAGAGNVRTPLQDEQE